MKSYPIYCAGNFVTSKAELQVTNKYSGRVIAKTFLANEEILDLAIKGAQAALRPCRELSSLEKYEALKFISESLNKNKKRLAELLCLESGKPIVYALAELERSVQTFLIAAEESKRLPKEYMSLDWTANGRNKKGIVDYFPVGIVGGIAPFNFPMNLAVHKIAPAIAAGCPIILKPASFTPLSTLELSKIIHLSGLPAGAVSVLPMDRKTGNLLVTDSRVNMLSFTGSAEIGWELKKQSGRKKVVLELGGNAGVIITSSARLPEIIKTCVTGAFAYSGQICIHAQRFYVHPVHYSKFVAAMKTAAQKLKNGDPLKPETEVSAMIDDDNARRVESWVKEAIADGATLIYGGKRKGSYLAPTILCNTNKRMKVNAEEVFGPVICIEKYNGKIADAVDKINGSRYGLQCGVFTDSVAELDFVFRNADVGGVLHNQVPTLRFDQMPYGGIKDSGLGREGVRYAILDMLEAKVLVK